jgi:DNA helicase-2/ATP-dependent DNA helicase PcrA
MNPRSRFVGEIPAELRQMSAENSLPDRGSWLSGSTRVAGGSSHHWNRSKSSPKKDTMKGRRYDYSDSQLDPFDDSGKVGRSVMHPSFGQGTVARVDGTGPQARVTVQFAGYGTKVIVARFLDFQEELPF